MRSESTVAVIVPVFNGGRYLLESLESIKRQTFRQWECVIVDDGSTDDTADIAQAMVDQDPRFRLIRQANAGTPAARNRAIDAAGPDVSYLAFVDGDDTLVAEALQVLVETLDAHPEAVGCYGLAEYMDSSGAPLEVGVHPSRQRDRRCMGRVDLQGLPPELPYTWSSLIVSGTLWPSAVGLHRRSVVDAVGKFDTDLKQQQDWDLYLRMSRVGPFVPIDKHIAWYRQHDSNVTSRLDRVAYYTLVVRRKVWSSDANSPRQRTELRRVWRRLLARYLCWSAIATVRAISNRQRAELRDGVAASATFAKLLIVGHPSGSDERTAPLVARFVLTHPARSAGSPSAVAVA